MTQQGDVVAVARDAVDVERGTADHEVDVDLAPVDPLVLGRILDRLHVTGAERDMARRVLVEQRVEEHRLERADPAVTVDESELTEARAAVVLRACVAQGVGVVVRVDLDRAPPWNSIRIPFRIEP